MPMLFFERNRGDNAATMLLSSMLLVAELMEIRAGSPGVIALPGLPQIRTGGFPASGSSRHGPCPQTVSTP